MALIAFASAKSSPGVTTALSALAATWPPGHRLLVAELDPAGGDLAVRFDLGPETGLVSLAAAGRREIDAEIVLAHTQALPRARRDQPPDEARRLLAGPVSADQAHAALVSVRGRLAPALAGMRGEVVLADCGRMDPSSPSSEVLHAADLVVVVVRPVLAEVHHLQARLSALALPSVSVLVVGERPYSVEDVARVVGVNPLAALPFDPRAALALAGTHREGVRVLRRSQLLRATRALAEGLVSWLAELDISSGGDLGSPSTPADGPPFPPPPPPHGPSSGGPLPPPPVPSPPPGTEFEPFGLGDRRP